MFHTNQTDTHSFFHLVSYTVSDLLQIVYILVVQKGVRWESGILLPAPPQQPSLLSRASSFSQPGFAL